MLVAAIGLAFPAWQSFRDTTVVVEWSTASEMETAGFNLLRGDSPEGPFERINEQLIPASPDPLTGGAYAYEDQGVSPGQTYYYQLEEVENSGQTASYGPIEVRANRSGWLELILVAGLGVLGLTGLLFSSRSSAEAVA